MNDTVIKTNPKIKNITKYFFLLKFIIYLHIYGQNIFTKYTHFNYTTVLNKFVDAI